MTDILLATAAHLPHLHEDDQILLKALIDHGIDARPAVWDDLSVDWGSAPMAIIRSTWDYVPKRDAFVKWAFETSKKTTLYNPADVVLWNTDKTYLDEFAKGNIPTVPTMWLAPGHYASLKDIVVGHGWPTVVIKPVVGASGVDTIKVTVDDLDEGQAFLDRLLVNQAVMIQPYFESIETKGESSLIFIAGKFTHALRKLPRGGDFKSQEEYGSELIPYTPTPHEMAIALSIVGAMADKLLYARVDFMKNDDDIPCLSELELVEPSLYLRFSEHAVNAFVDAIAERIRHASTC